MVASLSADHTFLLTRGLSGGMEDKVGDGSEAAAPTADSCNINNMHGRLSITIVLCLAHV